MSKRSLLGLTSLFAIGCNLDSRSVGDVPGAEESGNATKTTASDDPAGDGSDSATSTTSASTMGDSSATVTTTAGTCDDEDDCAFDEMCVDGKCEWVGCGADGEPSWRCQPPCNIKELEATQPACAVCDCDETTGEWINCNYDACPTCEGDIATCDLCSCADPIAVACRCSSDGHCLPPEHSYETCGASLTMFDLSNAFVEYSGCRDVAATAFNADHSLGLRIAIDRDLATTAIGDQNTAHIDLMLPNADITVEAHVGLSVDAAIDTCTDAYPLPLVDEVWHATGGSIEVSVEYVDGPDPYQVYATITLTNVTFARVEPGPSSDAPVLPSLSFETSVAWGPWGWQPGDGLGP